MEPWLKGIAFCGEDIEVSSIVLRPTQHDSVKQIESQLVKLKETHIRIDTHTIGFMFACIGRGHHLHDKYNVESNLFNRHFPSVPLFGFFGNGEIGYDYLPDYNKPGKDSGYTLMGRYPDQDHPNVPYIWDMPDIDLSYSTVFVLLSLPGGK